MSMEPAHEWDLTVPADDAELLAELHRHGIRPGQQLHLRIVREPPTEPTRQGFCGSLSGFPEPTWEDFEHASAEARRDFSVT